MRVLTPGRELQEVTRLTEADARAFHFIPVKNSSGSSFWVPKCDGPVWLNGRRKTVDGKTLDEL